MGFTVRSMLARVKMGEPGDRLSQMLRSRSRTRPVKQRKTTVYLDTPFSGGEISSLEPPGGELGGSEAAAIKAESIASGKARVASRFKTLGGKRSRNFRRNHKTSYRAVSNVVKRGAR